MTRNRVENPFTALLIARKSNEILRPFAHPSISHLQIIVIPQSILVHDNDHTLQARVISDIEPWIDGKFISKNELIQPTVEVLDSLRAGFYLATEAMWRILSLPAKVAPQSISKPNLPNVAFSGCQEYDPINALLLEEFAKSLYNQST